MAKKLKTELDSGNREDTQRKYMEFQMIQQNMAQMKEQLTMIEQQIEEMSAAEESISELANINEDTEMVVPIGSGVFVKTKVKGSNEFIINVGANVAVAKTDAEAKKIINEQIEEVKKVQKQINQNILVLNERAQAIQQELSHLLG